MGMSMIPPLTQGWRSLGARGGCSPPNFLAMPTKFSKWDFLRGTIIIKITILLSVGHPIYWVHKELHNVFQCICYTLHSPHRVPMWCNISGFNYIITDSLRCVLETSMPLFVNQYTPIHGIVGSSLSKEGITIFKNVKRRDDDDLKGKDSKKGDALEGRGMISFRWR